MQGKSVGLLILLWCEIIISARILLFALPVLIHRCQAKIFALINSQDAFMLLLSIVACIQFTAGIASLFGKRNSKSIHAQAAGLSILITSVFVFSKTGIQAFMSVTHFIPVVFSVAVAAILYLKKA